MRTLAHIGGLTLVCAWLMVLPVHALPDTISIKLFDAHPALESVEVRGPLRVITPTSAKVTTWDGTVKVVASRGAVLLYRMGKGVGEELVGSAPMVVVMPASGRGVEVVRADGIRRRYLGQLQFTSALDANNARDRRFVLSVIEITKSRDYVCAVLGSESPGGCPEEALKALAVMVLNRLETRARYQPLRDSTREQLYFGSGAVTRRVKHAVDEVYPWRLLSGKTVIESYFSSTCAGGTSSGSAIFGKAARHMHYLKSVKCDYCSASPFWKRRTTSVQEDKLVKIFGGVPEVSHK
ncbi:MAG: hypothetical protein K2Z81_15020, partial [Cyanobacteria bacterium]|nr:hypothetical protein [Cyanobacteriota bacterium]